MSAVSSPATMLSKRLHKNFLISSQDAWLKKPATAVIQEELRNDPHKKESANGNARGNVNFFHCYN